MIATRWAALAVGFLAAGALVAPTAVGATITLRGDGTVAARTGAADLVKVHHVPLAQQRAALAYWTPARMRSATSLDTVVRHVAPQGGQTVPATRGTPGAVAPSLPSGHTLPNTLISGGAQSGAQPMGFTYPFPFDRHSVFPESLYPKYPWEVNGKLYFTQNGTNFVCSGTAVSATNLNEVWTAGHCVNDGSQTWDTSAVFVPAYNSTAANPNPRGKFVANNFATSSGWYNSGDFSTDLGAITVNPNGVGKQLQNAVGAAGFAWNQARDQQYVDFGYPQGAPFNGGKMISCLGATAVYDSGIGGSGQAPNGIGCDMTGGSSGGSWQIQWGGPNGNSAGYINGHNDYKYASQPLAMYSPYFDDTANSVRCVLEVAGQNGC